LFGTLIILAILLGSFILTFDIKYHCSSGNPFVFHKDMIYVEEITTSVKITTYQPDTIQCDNSPRHTADSSYIPENYNELKWCAISRDLFKLGIHYGDTIEVLLDYPNYTRFNGKYVVHDCTSNRLIRTIDILSSDGFSFPGQIKFKKRWLKNKIHV